MTWEKEFFYISGSIFPSPKNDNNSNKPVPKRTSYMELSCHNLKKLLIFRERTLKSQAKNFFYFLRVSKKKFIHSSS